MKLLLLFLLLGLNALALDDRDALAAIAQRETRNRNVVGKAGELGPTQVAPVTVRQHGTTDPRVHLEWLKARFRERGVHWCLFNLALAWNAGFEGATTGRAPVSSYAYARDVVAIYERRARR